MPNEDDEVILKTLSESGIVATPKMLAIETGIDYDILKNRMRELDAHGFVKNPDTVPDGLSSRGVYELTELGERYLDGDVTVAELRGDTEE